MPVVDHPRTIIQILSQTEIPGDLENAVSTLVYSLAYSWSAGDGNQQFNYIFSDTRTCDAESAHTLDLLSYDFVNVAGEIVQLVVLKGLLIRNRSGSDTLRFSTNLSCFDTDGSPDNLLLRGSYVAGSNPGDLFLMISPNTGNLLANGSEISFTNLTASDIDYDIIFWGY